MPIERAGPAAAVLSAARTCAPWDPPAAGCRGPGCTPPSHANHASSIGTQDCMPPPWNRHGDGTPTFLRRRRRLATLNSLLEAQPASRALQLEGATSIGASSGRPPQQPCRSASTSVCAGGEVLCAAAPRRIRPRWNATSAGWPHLHGRQGCAWGMTALSSCQTGCHGLRLQHTGGALRPLPAAIQQQRCSCASACAINQFVSSSAAVVH